VVGGDVCLSVTDSSPSYDVKGATLVGRQMAGPGNTVRFLLNGGRLLPLPLPPLTSLILYIPLPSLGFKGC